MNGFQWGLVFGGVVLAGVGLLLVVRPEKRTDPGDGPGRKAAASGPAYLVAGAVMIGLALL